MHEDLVKELELIADKCNDPKKSQIQEYIPDWMYADADGDEVGYLFGPEGPIYVDKYETIYYCDLANRLVEMLENEDLTSAKVEVILKGIKSDIEDNKLGFVFDW